MSMIKTRINLSVSPDKRDILKRLAREEKVPVATKVMHLVDFALEFEEDAALYKLAATRDALKPRRYLTHEEFWKRTKSRHR